MTGRISAYAPLAWAVLRRRFAALRLAVARSSWTHRIIAGAAILTLFTVGGVFVLQTGWAEPAAAEGQRPVQPIPTRAPELPPLEFTLAPDAIRAISMDEARVFNAGLPFSTLPILSARPFIIAPDRLFDYARALDCLTAAVYYEAGAETAAGQAAVAQVVINRMRHPAYPKTVCGVVFEGQERTTGCHFMLNCYGAIARAPSAAGWARARAAAGAALNGAVAPEVGLATHYHTDWVAPYWAERLVKMRQIGTHIFYRWPGGWGLPGAFTGAHAGVEPVITKLAALATHVEELPEPVLETVEMDLTVAKPIILAAPITIKATASGQGEAEIEAEPVVETAVAPPPPPPVMANPLAPPSATAPQRRTRIAVPR